MFNGWVKLALTSFVGIIFSVLALGMVNSTISPQNDHSTMTSSQSTSMPMTMAMPDTTPTQNDHSAMTSSQSGSMSASPQNQQQGYYPYPVQYDQNQYQAYQSMGPAYGYPVQTQLAQPYGGMNMASNFMNGMPRNQLATQYNQYQAFQQYPPSGYQSVNPGYTLTNSNAQFYGQQDQLQLMKNQVNDLNYKVIQLQNLLNQQAQSNNNTSNNNSMPGNNQGMGSSSSMMGM